MASHVKRVGHKLNTHSLSGYTFGIWNVVWMKPTRQDRQMKQQCQRDLSGWSLQGKTGKWNNGASGTCLDEAYKTRQANETTVPAGLVWMKPTRQDRQMKQRCQLDLSGWSLQDKTGKWNNGASWTCLDKAYKTRQANETTVPAGLVWMKPTRQDRQMKQRCQRDLSGWSLRDKTGKWNNGASWTCLDEAYETRQANETTVPAGHVWMKPTRQDRQMKQRCQLDMSGWSLRDKTGRWNNGASWTCLDEAYETRQANETTVPAGHVWMKPTRQDRQMKQRCQLDMSGWSLRDKTGKWNNGASWTCLDEAYETRQADETTVPAGLVWMKPTRQDRQMKQRCQLDMSGWSLQDKRGKWNNGASWTCLDEAYKTRQADETTVPAGHVWMKPTRQDRQMKQRCQLDLSGWSLQDKTGKRNNGASWTCLDEAYKTRQANEKTVPAGRVLARHAL